MGTSSQDLNRKATFESCKLNLGTMKFYSAVLLVVLSVCCQLGSGCEDVNPYCSHWTSYCTQAAYRSWMLEQCQKTCGGCPVVTTDDSGSDSTGSVDQFAKEGLESHNKRSERSGHPLKLDSDLCKDAQAYADKLAAADTGMKHATAELRQKGQGENLYWASPITWSNGKVESQNPNAGKAVDSWYGEKTTGEHCKGHYTQVVWKSSKKYCMAKAEAASKATYVVARYYPAGNFVMNGQKQQAYDENVVQGFVFPPGC